MTPQEAAELVITCTATGLSGLPLWEYLPGMQVTVPGLAFVGLIQPIVARVCQVDGGELRLDAPMLNGGRCKLSRRADLVRPDFTDELTVQALYLLVRRAWKNYTLIVTEQDGVVSLVIQDSDERPHFVGCEAACAVFARALAKAPVRS